MSRWKVILCLLCLATWLPATQHCQLEILPGFDFLRCATDIADSDCQEDSCALVENGACKVRDTAEPLVVPVYGLLLCELAPAFSQPTSVEQAIAALADEPVPERPDSWKSYSSRALAIRGPSLLS